MKLLAVKIIRDLADKTNMRDLARKHGMNDGYFQNACGRNGDRVHNAVLRFPDWFPDDVVDWAKHEYAKRHQQSIEQREINRKLRARTPIVKRPTYPIDAHNYPSPHPQPRMKRFDIANGVR